MMMVPGFAIQFPVTFALSPLLVATMMSTPDDHTLEKDAYVLLILVTSDTGTTKLSNRLDPSDRVILIGLVSVRLNHFPVKTIAPDRGNNILAKASPTMITPPGTRVIPESVIGEPLAPVIVNDPIKLPVSKLVISNRSSVPSKNTSVIWRLSQYESNGIPTIARHRQTS